MQNLYINYILFINNANYLFNFLSCTRIYYQVDHHTISATRIAPVPSRAVANASMYLFPRIRHHCSGKYHFLAVSFFTFLSCSFNCRLRLLFSRRQADGHRQPLSNSANSGLSEHVSHLRIPYAVFGIIISLSVNKRKLCFLFWFLLRYPNNGLYTRLLEPLKCRCEPPHSS